MSFANLHPRWDQLAAAWSSARLAPALMLILAVASGCLDHTKTPQATIRTDAHSFGGKATAVVPSSLDQRGETATPSNHPVDTSASSPGLAGPLLSMDRAGSTGEEIAPSSMKTTLPHEKGTTDLEVAGVPNQALHSSDSQAIEAQAAQEQASGNASVEQWARQDQPAGGASPTQPSNDPASSSSPSDDGTRPSWIGFFFGKYSPDGAPSKSTSSFFGGPLGANSPSQSGGASSGQGSASTGQPTGSSASGSTSTSGSALSPDTQSYVSSQVQSINQGLSQNNPNLAMSSSDVQRLKDAGLLAGNDEAELTTWVSPAGAGHP